MALRDQPYLPLYIQDFLTDEKLSECSAESTGVYIRLMCIMHKSEEYGVIHLQEKYKVSDNVLENFTLKLSKQMPYDKEVVLRALNELQTEGVIYVTESSISQKRMINDNKLSLTRALSGKKGGFATAKQIANNTAKRVANTEYENENQYKVKTINNINDNDNSDNKSIIYSNKIIVAVIEHLNKKAGTKFSPKTKSNREFIRGRLREGRTLEDFITVIDRKCDEWLSDDKMYKYLRPETLFNATKFENYLNQRQEADRDRGMSKYM